jgi:succinate dehydrogenase/fumarate reductase-like Fe-S protein
MKIMVNEETFKMMKDLIPDTKNVFTKLKAATDLINSIKVEINNNLKDGEMIMVKEDNE